MKYFSRREIEDAIWQLAEVHPFFLITFLAAKRANLPVGRTMAVRLDAITDEFLQRHFRLHPKSKYFFKPYRGADKRRVWVSPDYASSGLQTVNTQTFKDVLRHPPNSRQWGLGRRVCNHSGAAPCVSAAGPVMAGRGLDIPGYASGGFH